jgi:hypothetical protein
MNPILTLGLYRCEVSSGEARVNLEHQVADIHQIIHKLHSKQAEQQCS